MTVYFIQAGEDGPIKIGFTRSKSVEKRLSDLQHGNAETLVVLASIEGSLIDEKNLHIKFSQFHIRGEWFEPSYELLAHISDLELSESFGGSVAQKKNVISSWRNKNQLTQKQAATVLGVTQGFISKVERGADVSFGMAINIASRSGGQITLMDLVENAA